jgi:predicted TPR repeat methyltransferase
MINVNKISYDNISEKWAEDRDKAKVPSAVIEFVVQLSPGGRVLDVGCGTGIPIDEYMVEQGLTVEGIDVSEKLLEKAKVNVPDASFTKSDVRSFETNETYDGIVAWDSLFHLELKDQFPVLEKLFGLLKSGGYFLFTHGGSEGEIEGSMHGNRFTYSSPGPLKIRSLFQSKGMKILSFEMEPEGNGYLTCLVQKV